MSDQPQPPAPHAQAVRQAQVVHNAAIVACVACPLLALLPPRKLDFFTLGLVGTTAYSGSYLLQESTGRNVWQHLSGTGQLKSVAIASTTDNTVQSSAVGELQKQGRGPGQRDAWKEQRQREIQQDVDEGKGLQDMIVDQIWEVWNWDKRGDEETSKEKD